MHEAYLSIRMGKMFLKYCQNRVVAFRIVHLSFTFALLHYCWILKLTLLIILCLTSVAGYAQTLKGRVTEAGTNKALFPVTVVNLRTQKATYTSAEGYYSVQAEAGDKIAYSFIGYKSRQYQMPISVGTYLADIQLESVNYRLEELYIMPDYTQYQLDSIERLQTYRPFLNRPRISPFSSPFSYVASKFNKRSKQIKKFKRNFGKWEDARYIDTRYTPELVAEMTGLEGDSLGYFMNANPMPFDYARTATELEMKMWIRYHYRNWIKTVDSTDIPQINDSLIQKN